MPSSVDAVPIRSLARSGMRPLALLLVLAVLSAAGLLLGAGHAGAATKEDDALQAQIDALEVLVAGQADAIAELQRLLAGVTRGPDAFRRDTLRLSGVNVQIVNGTGTTSGTPNGTGNLILGYNNPRTTPTATTAADRRGSHSLVVGNGHHWTSFTNIIAGHHNTATGSRASVLGGRDNLAKGIFSTVNAGASNIAGASRSAVLGGNGNTVGSTDGCHPGC